jgi:hypothetical protein
MMLLISGIHSLSQVSHSGHPLLMPPLPTFISHSHLSQTLPHVYIHHPTLIYMIQRRLFSPQPSSSFISLSPSLTPHFRFFWTIYGRLFATITISHPYISSTISLNGPYSPGYPILYPCPCPPFSLFWTIYGHFQLLSPFPITIHLLA